MLLGGDVAFYNLARRVAIHIVFSWMDKVLFAEATLFGHAFREAIGERLVVSLVRYEDLLPLRLEPNVWPGASYDFGCLSRRVAAGTLFRRLTWGPCLALDDNTSAFT